MDWLGAVFDGILQWVGSIGFGFVAAAVLALLTWLTVRFGAIKNFFVSRSRARRAVARQGRGEAAQEGPGVFLTRPIKSLPHHDAAFVGSRRVIAVGNLKGGVGKTTISANLGASLATRHAKRVLLIDLDFQGSLSEMAHPKWRIGPRAALLSPANRLISGDIDAAALIESAKPILPPQSFWDSAQLARPEQFRFDVIRADYDLAQAETRLLIHWLTDLSGDDVRFQMAKTLRAEPIRDHYDYVILDLPPRLTVASAQALAAASHFLTPTIMDRASAGAVVTFFDQVRLLAEAGVAPHLKSLGVAPTKIAGETAEFDAARQLSDLMADRFSAFGRWLPAAPFGDAPLQGVRDRAAYGRATAEGIAYLVARNAHGATDVRRDIDEIAQKVIERMN